MNSQQLSFGVLGSPAYICNHSQFAIRNSQFAIRNSQFAIRNSQLSMWRVYMKKTFRGMAVATAAYFAGHAWAAPELQVKFHMGIGNGTTQEVGGTLINVGDAPIAQGYLVITPIATQCHPKASVMYPFGLLVPGEEYSFRVHVADGFSNYRLQMGAFDEQGFAVTAKDANQAILDARISEERELCNTAREKLNGKDH